MLKANRINLALEQCPHDNGIAGVSCSVDYNGFTWFSQMSDHFDFGQSTADFLLCFAFFIALYFCSGV